MPKGNGYSIDGGTVRLQSPSEPLATVDGWRRPALEGRALEFVEAVDVNDEAWAQICSRRSVPGSTLVWQTLADEGRAVRDPVPAPWHCASGAIFRQPYRHVGAP